MQNEQASSGISARATFSQCHPFMSGVLTIAFTTRPDYYPVAISRFVRNARVVVNVLWSIRTEMAPEGVEPVAMPSHNESFGHTCTRCGNQTRSHGCLCMGSPIVLSLQIRPLLWSCGTT